MPTTNHCRQCCLINECWVDEALPRAPRLAKLADAFSQALPSADVRQNGIISFTFIRPILSRTFFITGLPKLLVQIGRKENLQRIVGYVSRENTDTKCVMERVGSELRLDEENDCWTAQIQLR
jgi:hypothetical protein